MCTQVHPRQVEHDMKEPLNARVYIDGKNRPLFVSTPYETIQGQIQAGAHGLVVTDLSGEVITVPMGRVQSAAQVAPEDMRTVAIEPGVMEGRKVTIRSMGVWRMLTPEQGGPDESERGWFDYPAESVVVIAEDLADAVVLVATEQGEPLWENPASEPGATRRYARAVRLICQAESIEIRAQQAEDAQREALRQERALSEVGVQTTRPDDMLDEDQRNAMAFLESGDEGSVRAAINIAGVEFVLSYLEGRSEEGAEVVGFVMGDDDYGKAVVEAAGPMLAIENALVTLDVDPTDVPEGVVYEIGAIDRFQITNKA
jgi:hypothetical protein